MTYNGSTLRSAIRVAIGTIAFLSMGCHQGPPSVVLVSLDTLRADRLGAYGSPLSLSPVLDRLAEESVVFDRTVAQCSHTYDSHKSLFLSRYPTLGTEEDFYLAELFREAGYQTAAFTGGGMVAAEFGFDRGFEIYEEAPGGFRDSLPRFEAWLAGRDPEHAPPFFVFLHSYDIHAPYEPDLKYVAGSLAEYDGPIRPEDTSILIRQVMGLDPPREGLDEVEWTEDDRRWIEALYNGGVKEVDELFFSRILASLTASPSWEWDRDMLIVFSDHGEEFFEHGSLGHGLTLYQEMLHVPLIIRLPGGEHGGSRIHTQVELMDVAPTLLELAGMSPPQRFSGRSLLPLIADRNEATDRVAIALTVGGLRTIINYPWKLISSDPQNIEELYNLDDDPKEAISLAALHPDIVHQLRETLSASLSGNVSLRESIVAADEVSDGELLEQLRALGYLAESSQKNEPHNSPAPK